ncbi:MAG: hypothetical protein M3R52_02945 [Acidobacteriota bacterium]|nr:hypothetical protein [Acidobacteriota bacterium]
MKKTTLLMLAVPLVLAACSAASRKIPTEESVTPSPSPSPSSAASRKPPTEEWQTSWIKFVQEVDAFRQQHQNESEQVPETTFQMTLHGQRVPQSWGIMKRFGGTVEFEGTFKGIKLPSEKEKLMEGQTVKLDLAMPTNFPKALENYGGALLHAYPKSSAVEAWQKTSIGASVRFRATVTGVAVFAMPIRGGLFQYHVLMEDAELLH